MLETLSYAISLAYSFRNAFPFSTYGENLFLTLQNVLITLLIIHYSGKGPAALGAAAVLSAATAYALAVLAPQTLALLQMATLPLGLFSKLPQIAQNARARSTGQLSAFAVGAQVLGCAARIFTTATEVGDPLLQAGFVLALVLNLVLAAQMYVYWGREERPAVAEDAPVKEKLAAKEFGWASGTQTHVENAVPAPPIGVAHQQQQNTTGSPAPPGRRWARKVD